MANAGALARGDFVDRAVRALDAAMAGAGQSTTRELTTDRGEIWAFVGALKVGLGLLTALEAVEASGAVIGLSVVWLLQRSWSR